MFDDDVDGNLWPAAVLVHLFCLIRQQRGTVIFAQDNLNALATSQDAERLLQKCMFELGCEGKTNRQLVYCYKFTVAHLTGLVILLTLTRCTGRDEKHQADEHAAKDNCGKNCQGLLHQILIGTSYRMPSALESSIRSTEQFVASC